MHLEKKKEIDCHSFFMEEMQLVKSASDHLNSILLQCRPASVPKTLPLLEQLENQGTTIKQELLQNTLTAFITPWERKDIVRFSNALLSILNSLSESARTLSALSPTRLRPETGGYRPLLEDCCQNLLLLLPKLQEKKKLPFLLSQTEGLHRYAKAGKRYCSSCLQRICQEAGDSGQLFVWYRLYMSFFSVFERYADSAKLLEEIFCDY